MAGDRAQLGYLLDSLARYGSSGDRPEVSLKKLVRDVDVTVGSLTESPLRQQLDSEWWTLEQVYAYAVQSGEFEDLSPESVELVEEAVRKIRELAEGALAALPSDDPGR